MIPLDCRRDTLAEQSEAGVLQPEAGDIIETTSGETCYEILESLLISKMKR